MSADFIVHLPTIVQRTNEQKIANERFGKFLRQFPSSTIDAQVRCIADEVSAAIDCTACGNCCKALEPPITTDEINALALNIHATPDQFVAKYCSYDDSDEFYFMHAKPCIFLADNKCTIYSTRPASCAEFPHLHKPDFKYRWKSVMANCGVCPIVFNVVERLKSHLQFNYLAEK